MKTSSSNKRSFGKGMLVYAIIFILISVIILCIFWLWAREYEHSRPAYAINKYLSSLTSEHVSELSSPLLSEIDLSFQDNDEIVGSLYNMIISSTPAKSISLSNDNEQVYLLENNGNYIEQLKLVPGKEDLFGFKPWVVSEETMLFDSMISSSNILVPDTWTVKWNEEVLDSRYVVGDKVEYSLLNGFYEDFNDLPYMVTYSSGTHFGSGTMSAVDENGNIIGSENLNELYYCDNCTEAEKSDLKNYCNTFIDKYVKYTSNGIVYGNTFYNDLLSIIKPNSSLYQQIRESIQGFGYASSNGDQILDIRIPQCMKIGNGRYVCQIEYDVETYGSHERVTDQTFNIRLMIEEENGAFKATAVLFY